MAVSGTYAAAFLDSAQVGLSHQTRHTVLSTHDPLCPQLGMNAWTAIDLPSQLIGLANVLGQSLILPLAMTGFAFAPGVIATFRNSQHTTHRFHGILLLMVLNKPIPPLYVLENTMKAFFKISRCWRVTSSSRLRRRSSSSWAVWWPLPGKASSS
jgi:hypothetical protein